MKPLFVCVALAFFVSGSAGAADEPVKISLASPRVDLKPGATATVRLNFEIAEPYHIYSTVQQLGPRGAGPTATAISLKPADLVALDGALRTSPANKHYDPNFDLDVLTLEGRAWIDVPLKAAAGLAPGSHPVELVVSYQACNEESCLPPADLAVPLEIFVSTTGTAADDPRWREADQAYAELRARRMERPPPGDVATTSAFQRKQHDEVSRRAERLYDANPNDPHRCEIIMWAVNSPRLDTVDDTPEEKARWEKRRTELRKLLLADASAPDNIWTTVAEWTIDDNSGFRGRPVGDLAWVGRVVEQMAKRVPASDRRKFAEEAYLDGLRQREPAAVEPFLRTRVAETETNSAVREMAAGRLRIIEAARAPLDLKFTAADGREVDLEKMRGKVVLIDFWATWCVPCMEEMPNVRAAYEKYHSQGFEVIGIAFENSRLTKTDTPEVIAQKKQAAKDKLLKFVGEKAMPWPHHFDGEFWNNEFGRRFAIHEIPTAFLIGKDGRLITTETRRQTRGGD